ncbi:hypothetical protein BC332_28028 [Capsicum chinense]|nr:hypothetical protein BC332_28028 [Capsicum chinense]
MYSSMNHRIRDFIRRNTYSLPSLETCGVLHVFVVVYAEYLSEGLGIPCLGIDAQYHRLRYASLLCKYESEKAEKGYFSENDDPPRPRSKFAPKETDRVLHIK